MKFEWHRAQTVTEAFVFAAIVAWVAMMASGLLAQSFIEAYYGHLGSDFDEFFFTAVFVTAIPSGLVIVVVFFPLMLAIRKVRRHASPLFLAVAGMITAPLVGLVIRSIGNAMWGPPVPGRLHFIGPLVGLMTGGLTFGMLFGQFWQPRSTIVQLPDHAT